MTFQTDTDMKSKPPQRRYLMPPNLLVSRDQLHATTCRRPGREKDLFLPDSTRVFLAEKRALAAPPLTQDTAAGIPSSTALPTTAACALRPSSAQQSTKWTPTLIGDPGSLPVSQNNFSFVEPSDLDAHF